MFDNITIFYDDAEMHISPNNADKAVSLIKKKLRNGEETAQNYAFLANAYYFQDKNLTALRYALKAKELDPDYYYADMLLVDIYLDEEKFVKAQKHLDILLEKAPEDYYLKYHTAIIFYSRKTDDYFDKLQVYAQKLIELDYKDPFFYMVLAYAYCILNDNKKAFKYIFKSISKSFFDYHILQISALAMIIQCALVNTFGISLNLVSFLPRLMTLCGFLNDDGQYYSLSEIYDYDLEAALKYIEKAIKIKNKPIYQIRRALILYHLERYDEAIEICERILKQDDSFVQCYGILSDCYFDTKDYEKSLKYINLVILNNVTNRTILRRKVDCLYRLGRFEQVLEGLKKIEELYPAENDAAYYHYYIAINDFNKALLYANKLILKNNSHNNLLKKAKVLCAMQKYDKAIEICEKILEADDQESVAYYWIAVCKYETRQYEEALEFINKSIMFDGNDEWDFVTKYRILSALNRPKEAEFAYKKAVDLGYEE